MKQKCIKYKKHVELTLGAFCKSKSVPFHTQKATDFILKHSVSGSADRLPRLGKRETKRWKRGTEKR